MKNTKEYTKVEKIEAFENLVSYEKMKLFKYVALLSLSIAAIGVGAYFTIDQCIAYKDYINSGVQLSHDSLISLRIKEMLGGVSTALAIFGGFGTYYFGGEVKDTGKVINEQKARIRELKKDE
jgi:hypothetical protein